MPKSYHPRRSDLATLVVVGALLAGCEDDRLPLGQCDYGRYWADCGGDGPPVVACETSTGECRNFLGGATARGYVESDCPLSELCCHGSGEGVWAFTGADWSPDGDVAALASRDIGLLRNVPVSRDEPAGVPVVVDYTPTGGDRYRVRIRRFGESLLISGPRGGTEIEVWTTTTGTRRARVFRHDRAHVEGVPVPGCFVTAGSSQDVRDGVLHLSADDGADPAELHGLLEGADGYRFEF